MRKHPELLAAMPRLCVWIALLCGATLYGQEYRGRIQGTVVDATDAVVVGANVTLVNASTNASANKVTSETGHYLFDLIEPGTYTLTVQMAGFHKFQVEKVVLQQRGDVTVDAALEAGATGDTVTVTANLGQVQFNTSKLETTIDSRVAANVPQYFRQPFFLAAVDPTAVQRVATNEVRPFNAGGVSNQNISGPASTAVDLQVDGAPVGLGQYTGYSPSPDMVAEVNVQQNAVDAEFGNSAGAAISILLKSGTNEVHGGAFYQGMYPWLNAISDRVNRTMNVGRNHFFGGTLSHPIKKNKWLNFVAFEGWQMTDASLTVSGQLPTDLEKQGNFSQSLNSSGNLRVIYDPWTTQTSPDGKTVTRTAFPNNIVPASRISRVAAMYTAALPQPNLPGTGPYHALNYVVPLPIYYPYRNFSDRTDYVINEKLRYAGRVSLFRTPASVSSPTGNDLFFLSERGSDRNATQITNDLTWVKSANTVISGSFAYYGYFEQSHFQTGSLNQGKELWPKLWPNNSWYQTMFASGAIPMVAPGMEIMGGNGSYILNSYSYGLGTNGPYWVKRPHQNAVSVKIAQQRGTHYLKSGFETRGAHTPQVAQISIPAFMFDATATANTYVSPNTAISGDGYAAFLLGAYNNLSRGAGMPVSQNTEVSNRSYGAYFNDDWKLSRRVTINLGLRYEYEVPFHEAQNRLPRALDLSVPIPALQGANAPQMPAAVKQYYNGPWIFNGAFQWQGGSHPGAWDGGLGTLSPRAGIALRLNDKTAVRVGWGRFITPWLAITNMTAANAYGFNVTTPALPFVQGVPQLNLDDPFPASYPIQAAPGKSLGASTGLGDSLTYFNADRPRQHTDRYSLSVQRQLPLGITAEFTGLMTFSNNVITRNLNQVDPRIAYTYKAATNVQVPNPFYNLLPASQFPGPLGRQASVNLTSLMVPYPQYGSLTVTDYGGNGGDHFQQLAMKFRKAYSYGLTLMGGYAYLRSRSLTYYDDIATYLQQQTWQESTSPRHQVSLAGNWEIPLGHGRAFLNAMPRIMDAALGGWAVSPLLTWRSGNYLSFGGLLASGDPHVSDPGPGGWFNTAVFAKLPAYTPRTNPITYSGLTGPGYFNLDVSFAKSFRVTERFSAVLRMDVFHAPNNMTWNDPSTSVTSTYFGKSSGQFNPYGLGIGRQTQIGLRVRF